MYCGICGKKSQREFCQKCFADKDKVIAYCEELNKAMTKDKRGKTEYSRGKGGKEVFKGIADRMLNELIEEKELEAEKAIERLTAFGVFAIFLDGIEPKTNKSNTTILHSDRTDPRYSSQGRRALFLGLAKHFQEMAVKAGEK